MARWWNPASWFRGEGATYSIGDDAVLQAFFGTWSEAMRNKIRVNKDTALKSTAVLACLIVRSETHSALPVDVHRRVGRYRVNLGSQSPVYNLLGVAPNDLMTAGEFWRWEDLREDIHGNAYARVKWRGYNPIEIWPLMGVDPVLTWDKEKGVGAYQYQGDDFTPAGTYPPREILHFRGPILQGGTLGGRGLMGKSLVELASETIGAQIASEQFFSRLLQNGSHFPGWLETDEFLDDDDLNALVEQQKKFRGVLQAGVLRIFDRGLKYQSNPMSIVDADLTNQQRWFLQQICSVLRVPLAMVQDLTHGTYTNSEQQDLWLGKHTILPMCVNKERTVAHKLFVGAGKAEQYLKFNMAGLLRGDYKTRMEGHAAAINSGFMGRNEARGLEDWNPAPGLDPMLVNLGYGIVRPDGSVEQRKSEVEELKTRADVAAILLRSGYVPDGSLDVAGLPPIEARPVWPVTVQPAPKSGENGDGGRNGGGSPTALLEPIIADAIACIEKRLAYDQKKRRNIEETIAFAAEKLGPVVEAHDRAGLDFDPDLFIAQAVQRQQEAEVTS